MPRKFDRVRVIATAVGVGPFTIVSAAPGAWRTPSAAGAAAGDRMYYAAVQGDNFEVGIGKLVNSTSWTVVREQILSSSANDGPVNFAAGDIDLFSATPAKSGYWVATLSVAANFGFPYGVCVDSSSSIGVTGRVYISGNYYPSIAKFSVTGKPLWQKYITTPSSVMYSCVKGEDGYIYAVGVIGTDGYAFKIDFNSGDIVWQKKITSGYPEFCSFFPGAGGVICSVTSGNDSYIVRFGADGTLTWQFRLYSATLNETANGLITDSAGETYWALIAPDSSYQQAAIAKISAGGLLRWQRFLRGANINDFKSVAIDAAEANVYALGRTRDTDDKALIAKYSAAGALQWQKKITGGTGTSIYGKTVLVNPSGLVLAVCLYSGRSVLVCACDPGSGNIEWQREITGVMIDYGITASLDPSGALVIAGRSISNMQVICIVKIDSAGEVIDSAGPVVVQASFVTGAASTLTDSAGTLSFEVSALSVAAGTVSAAASTLQTALYEIQS